MFAQGAGTVEGRVTSSTDHNGIAGVTVNAASQRATTDASGAFRVTGLAPGSVTFSFEAPGFLPSGRAVAIDSAIGAAHLAIELIPHSSIAGRVVDDEGKPVAKARVEITQAVRGTGTTWRRWGAETDAEGRYECDGLAPGAYLATARPNPGTRGGTARVRTYYPSVAERGQAGKLVLRGGTHLAADIRVLAVGVRTVRGMVIDDGGKPADASVSLAPSEFLETAEFRGQAHDGAFEFRDVPAGEWRVTAEADRAGTKLRGTAAAPVDRHDIENLTVRLAAPFALQAIVEPRGLNDTPALELNPAEPIHVVFSPNAAALCGAVEDCAGAVVLLLPQDEGLWNFRFIRRAACDATGHFEVGGLRPGEYYAMALDRIDDTGLDDLSTLRRLASVGERVQVDGGRVGYVELKVSRWPE